MKRISLWISLVAAFGALACTRGSQLPEDARWRPAANERAPEGFEVCESLPAIDGWAARVRDPRTHIAFRFCPRGEFVMGPTRLDPPIASRATPQFVRIDRPFYLAETETTRAQWQRYEEVRRKAAEPVRAKPDVVRDELQSSDHPIVDVSWPEAHDFCERYGYRLPSEAEWEYAARAGTRTAFEWGDDPAAGKGRANVGDEDRAATGFGWEHFDFADGFAFVAPVARYPANVWGLHDMTGNVWEWCQDVCVHEYERPAPTQAAFEDGDSSTRVTRGGGWQALPHMFRLGYRAGHPATEHGVHIGFRAAIDAR